MSKLLFSHRSFLLSYVISVTHSLANPGGMIQLAQWNTQIREGFVNGWICKKLVCLKQTPEYQYQFEVVSQVVVVLSGSNGQSIKIVSKEH